MFIFLCLSFAFFFFFNDTATTEIYTLSLHDALPISEPPTGPWSMARTSWSTCSRSEEHTSELQSRLHLVCRLLLEKKKTKKQIYKILEKKRQKRKIKINTKKE